MPRSRKVSQVQIATELSVSQTLVSLVLNGHRTGIKAETYSRIWEHAVKRGYRPKGMSPAASPAGALPSLVGFIVRAPLRLNSLGSYFSNVQHGLHTGLESEGLSTSFLGSEDQLDIEKLRRHFSAGHPYRGVVVIGDVARPFLTQLLKLERRVVSISATYPGLCHSVVSNEKSALDQLMRHLHELGHKRFGWLGGNVGMSRHASRFKAFQNAIAEFGLTYNERYTTAFTQADRAAGMESAQKLLSDLKRRDFPTAFICYNGLMAEGATSGFKHAGFGVPEDLSVAGCDFPRTPSADNPTRITGSGTDPVKLGESAAHLILSSTGSEDEAFTDLLLPSPLVLGETTGPRK